LVKVDSLYYRCGGLSSFVSWNLLVVRGTADLKFEDGIGQGSPVKLI